MDAMAKRYPGLKDPAAFDTFKRKWRYFFAYAGAGFAKGYISCHMLTFYKVRSEYFNKITNPGETDSNL